MKYECLSPYFTALKVLQRLFTNISQVTGIIQPFLVVQGRAHLRVVNGNLICCECVTLIDLILFREIDTSALTFSKADKIQAKLGGGGGS